MKGCSIKRVEGRGCRDGPCCPFRVMLVHRTVTAPWENGRRLRLCCHSAVCVPHSQETFPLSSSSYQAWVVCVCGGGDGQGPATQAATPERPMAGSGLLRKQQWWASFPSACPSTTVLPSLHGDLAPISKARGLSIYLANFKTPSSRKSWGKAAVKRVPLG